MGLWGEGGVSGWERKCDRDREGKREAVRVCRIVGGMKRGIVYGIVGEREGLADGREGVVDRGRGRGKGLECAGLWEG